MLYKFISENSIKVCPKNGIVNGKAISNLAEYFKIHPEIAKKEGYYPLVVSARPDIDNEQQYLEAVCVQNSNNIRQEWRIKNIEEDYNNEDE